MNRITSFINRRILNILYILNFLKKYHNLCIYICIVHTSVHVSYELIHRANAHKAYACVCSLSPSNIYTSRTKRGSLNQAEWIFLSHDLKPIMAHDFAWIKGIIRLAMGLDSFHTLINYMEILNYSKILLI